MDDCSIFKLITICLLIGGTIFVVAVFTRSDNMVNIQEEVAIQITNNTTNKEIMSLINTACDPPPFLISTSECKHNLIDKFIIPYRG